MPIRRTNYTLAIKNASKADAQAMVDANPAVWGDKGFTRIFNSKYRNPSNHIWWVSHGPLTEAQYNAIFVNGTAAGWIVDNTLLIASDKEKSPQEALAEWGLTPEPTEI